MDKETLSNYGWIVIAVLVLAVMIALAIPFGRFVSKAVQNTTQGLFDVNQNALDAVNITIADQSFDNAGSGNNGTQIKDPALNPTGITIVDGKYTHGDYEYTIIPSQLEQLGFSDIEELKANIGSLTGGMTWDEFIASSGTTEEEVIKVLTCCDIEVKVTDTAKTEYGPILESINRMDITNLDDTFYSCRNLVVAPEIPNSVISMCSTFSRCSSLVTAPIIPIGVTTMDRTFEGCTNLITAPVIPNGVWSMWGTFNGCSNLKTYHNSTDPDGDFSNYILPNNNIELTATFSDCTSLTKAPVIPSNIYELTQTFQNCESLSGVIKVPCTAKLYSATLGSKQVSIETYHVTGCEH